MIWTRIANQLFIFYGFFNLYDEYDEYDKVRNEHHHDNLAANESWHYPKKEKNEKAKRRISKSKVRKKRESLRYTYNKHPSWDMNK